MLARSASGFYETGVQDARRECAERTGFQRKGFHWKSGSGGKGYHDRPGAHRPASRRGQHLLPPADTLPAAGGPCGPSDPVLPPEPPCPAIWGGEGGPCEKLDPPGRAAPLSRSGTCPVFSTQGGRPSSALRYPGGDEVVSRERKACLPDCVPDVFPPAPPSGRSGRPPAAPPAGRRRRKVISLTAGAVFPRPSARRDASVRRRTERSSAAVRAFFPWRKTPPGGMLCRCFSHCAPPDSGTPPASSARPSGR